MTQNKTIENSLLSIFTFTICLIVFVLMLTTYLDVSVKSLYTVFTTYLFKPHYNKITSHPIVPKLYYQFIIFTTLTTWVTLSLHSLIFKQQIRKNIIPSLWICAILLFTALQQSKRVEYLKKEHKKFAHKTEDERNIFLFKSIYLFSKTSKDILIGTHYNAEFRSDTDLSQSPYMIMRSLLKYHLYPDIIFDGNSPKNIIVFINEKDEIQIPEEFEIIYQTPNKGLILTINKAFIK